VCTLGPSSNNEETIRKMIISGMDVARFNMSHGNYTQHLERMKMVKKISDELKKPVALMLDTKGPEVRIGIFKNNKIIVNNGQKFTFTTDDVIGDDSKVHINYPGIVNDLLPGDIIMVNNGLLKFMVMDTTTTDVTCKCIEGGELSNQKSCNFPGKVLSMKYLSEIDKKDLLFGCEQEVDYVSASFVSSKDDLIDLIDFLNKNGGRNIGIIAKIENQSGVNNIDEILSVCDGLMVARGDMGVEIDFHILPGIQKKHY
jgi:pyruvate kinase